MSLPKNDITSLFRKWINSWNQHNIEEVFSLLHDEVVFENWTGSKIKGKSLLKKAWVPWFSNHEDFKFIEEDLFYDETEQKLLFMWRLEWPSLINQYKGKREVRRGIDIIHFANGKIIKKYSYSKTTIQIEGLYISLEK